MLYYAHVKTYFDYDEDNSKEYIYSSLVTADNYSECVSKIENDYDDILSIEVEELAPDNSFSISNDYEYYEEFKALIEKYKKDVIW